MKIGVIKESSENRVALVPSIVKKFAKLKDAEIMIQKNISEYFSDQEYIDAGAKIVDSRDEILKTSDFVFRLNSPSLEEISMMKEGSLSVSHIDPYGSKELLDAFSKAKVNSISMEMIPRSTLAQKMDALSSQASLAGYVAVVKAAEIMDKIFPMMMTPSGTISPAKVFIIGAGVAGLQAIATAKRMGAKVEAFDTRPVVEEQVKSLGAKFVKVDLGEMGQTKDGYAKELTKEQLAKQQEAMKESCVNSDLVITTAKLFGRKAPVIISDDILKAMKKGSVIVDLAAGTGGNVAGTVVDETVEIHGVKVIGIDNLPGEVAIDSSAMYANNIYNLFMHFYDSEAEKFKYDLEEEIMSACLINYNGDLVNKRMIDFWRS